MVQILRRPLASKESYYKPEDLIISETTKLQKVKTRLTRKVCVCVCDKTAKLYNVNLTGEFTLRKSVEYSCSVNLSSTTTKKSFLIMKMLRTFPWNYTLSVDTITVEMPTLYRVIQNHCGGLTTCHTQYT
jgi:hypothetical protein